MESFYIAGGSTVIAIIPVCYELMSTCCNSLYCS